MEEQNDFAMVIGKLNILFYLFILIIFNRAVPQKGTRELKVEDALLYLDQVNKIISISFLFFFNDI